MTSARETVAQTAVITVVRPRSGWGTANLAHECDPRDADRADARGWRNCVPFGPRAHVHGHGTPFVIAFISCFTFRACKNCHSQ